MDSRQVEKVLDGLKDFQQETVEYVFNRMYDRIKPSKRFLVADEVGLGKTLVARGLIAKVIQKLQEDNIDRIDIIYVCSNAAIAAQNIQRLNILEGEHLAMSTRLTLLPTTIDGLKSNRVNFVSFTPGTTLDIKKSGGRIDERAVLCKMLRNVRWLDGNGLVNLLQGGAGRNSWRWWVDRSDMKIDQELAHDFILALEKDNKLRERLKDACVSFRNYRPKLSWDDRSSRNRLIGEMRHLLARVCVNALEPDLVILDEFQRFKHLLDSDDETAELARELMEYQDVRILLLSATPYKMYALDCEMEDDHYPDFIRTLRFLLEEDEVAVEEVERDIGAYRRALFTLSKTTDQELGSIKSLLQDRLGQVMVRTERVASTRKRDAMVREKKDSLKPTVSDITEAQVLDRVARSVESGSIIEYWKSSPYLLNFAHYYKIRRSLEANARKPSSELFGAVKDAAEIALSKDQFDQYLQIDPGNARMRALFEDMLDTGMWRLLWMPASLPYYEPAGNYQEAGKPTKALVFSSWKVVPDAIVALCSYEAERRTLASGGISIPYEELYRRNKGLLLYKVDMRGRLAGMPVLALSFPCATLAELVDPLAIALSYNGEGLPSREFVLTQAETVIEENLKELDIPAGPEESREDQRWYWAAAAMLDAAGNKGVTKWVSSDEGWKAAGAGSDDGEDSGFQKHVDYLGEFFTGKMELGRPPADLARVLAMMAVGGPAVCALRALHRVTKDLSFDAHALLDGASTVAEGFRGLFNMPESMALLRAERVSIPYWRQVLDYCVDGNLQAILDEYSHSLKESLGFIDEDSGEIAEAIAEEVSNVLSLRTARLDIDEVTVDEDANTIGIEKVHLRCRFALRLGDIIDDAGAVMRRTTNVRQAFNSPFRPFVLATTSIGQEGLDFHTYCHRVYHWNLPSNPVDLEQREGRVNRYKGHAIRKNVALDLGLEAIRGSRETIRDPWDYLFEQAKHNRPEGSNDLIPYWIYELDTGGFQVERKVPVLAYSREHSRFRTLKRSLALYRMVFGQPRQEDLLAQVERICEDGDYDPDTLEKWAISLSPWDLSS